MIFPKLNPINKELKRKKNTHSQQQQQKHTFEHHSVVITQNIPSNTLKHFEKQSKQSPPLQYTNHKRSVDLNVQFFFPSHTTYNTPSAIYNVSSLLATAEKHRERPSVSYYINIYYMSGSKGTAKLPKEFRMVVFTPYLVKHALLHIVVPYF